MKWGLGAGILLLVLIGLPGFVNPPLTPYMYSERQRLGKIRHEWVSLEAVARSASLVIVAAEDANFCRHWGIDIGAIRTVLQTDAERGASTITQQVVKNVFLWQGRSWLRKGVEAVFTPLVELLWSKRRILEVYVNVVEFDAGVFGIGAAAQHYFGVTADRLTTHQGALLAATLPAPKRRSASTPSEFVEERAAAAEKGALTIQADGRARCFSD